MFLCSFKLWDKRRMGNYRYGRPAKRVSFRMLPGWTILKHQFHGSPKTQARILRHERHTSGCPHFRRSVMHILLHSITESTHRVRCLVVNKTLPAQCCWYGAENFRSCASPWLVYTIVDKLSHWYHVRKLKGYIYNSYVYILQYLQLL